MLPWSIRIHCTLGDLSGSVYDGNQWKSVSTETAYGEKNLFYWLHQDGFYGETQLASIRNLVKDDSLSSTEGTVSVENEKATAGMFIFLMRHRNCRKTTGASPGQLTVC